MPRTISRVDAAFSNETAKILESLDLVDGAIRHATLSNSERQKALSLAYEGAFLKIICLWEEFIFEALKRYTCGQQSRGGIRVPLAADQSYSKTLTDAERRILNGKDYCLWHKVSWWKGHVNYFAPGNALFLEFDTLTASYENLQKIRHAIAHKQRHAQVEFEQAALQISGKSFAGEVPGLFLQSPSTDVLIHPSFLHQMTTRLRSHAQAICRL